MTKKHFNALAAALASHREEIPSDAFCALVHDIAGVCKQSNPNFSRDRFFEACERPLANR
jgi:hypothetical protein